MFPDDPDGKLEKQSISCTGKGEVCESFIIAMIPTLKYQTYDVYIHLRQNPNFQNMTEEVEFQYTYVNEEYTIYFLTFRGFWVIVSSLVFLVYLVQLKRKLTERWYQFWVWPKLRAK